MARLPTELLQIISKFVLEESDPETLKACSLGIPLFQLFFQKALFQEKTTTFAFHISQRSQFRSTITTLRSLIDANSAFSELIYHVRVDLGGVTNLSDPSGTLVRDFCLILASCVNVQSLSLTGDYGDSETPLNWGSIQYPIRTTLERVISGASLEHLEIDCLGLPLTSILRQKDSLISLTLHHVSDRGSPKKNLCSPNPDSTGPPLLDLSRLQIFETVFDIGGVFDLDTTIPVRNAIIGARNLNTLSLVVGMGAEQLVADLFQASHPACINTLEHIYCDTTLVSLCNITILDGLKDFPPENALRSITLVIVFYGNGVRDHLVSLLTEVLTKDRFPCLDEFNIVVKNALRTVYPQPTEGESFIQAAAEDLKVELEAMAFPFKFSFVS